jgi:hypothetical protein
MPANHLLSLFSRRGLAALALLPCTLFAQPSGVPLMNPPLEASKPAAPAAKPAAPVVNGFTTTNWDALVPADWDPFKDFRGLDIAAMQDGDPRTEQLMKKMREAWDKAPTNPALVGQKVRIPGFVVPLEDSAEGLKEFLLVPYFGACIHSPPPPANQIIHILPRTPAKGVRSMDAVWIHGVITVERTDSYMGMAGYRIEAQEVLPYQERKR